MRRGGDRDRRQGKRVLLTMCNAKERLSAMLESPPIGDEIVQVAPNIWAVNMNPEKQSRSTASSR
jgi:hypothetical protein